MLSKRTFLYLAVCFSCAVVGFYDDLLPASFPRGDLVPMQELVGAVFRGLARVLTVVSFLLFAISLLFGKYLAHRR